jgi:uncharacterized membrane protein
MHSVTVVSSSIAGIVFLILGLIVVRKDFLAASGLGKLVVLGPVFVAASLATFGAEHLAAARGIAQLVPAWMPAHLFWAYFFGVALLAAAISFDLRKCVRWSAPLLALMFFIFVVTMDIPSVVSDPKNRIDWVLLCRETAFALGALALTAVLLPGRRAQLANVLTTLVRVGFGAVTVFYGIEHFLHPECVIGVPLEKVTPAWVPLPHLWAYLVGIFLVIAGVALLVKKRAELSAALVGLVMTALTLFFYVPILATDRGTEQLVEGINYVFDTLLFAGMALLVARAMRNERL